MNKIFMSYIDKLNAAFKVAYEEMGTKLHSLLQSSVKDTEGAGIWKHSPLNNMVSNCHTFDGNMTEVKSKRGRKIFTKKENRDQQRKETYRGGFLWLFTHERTVTETKEVEVTYNKEDDSMTVINVSSLEDLIKPR